MAVGISRTSFAIAGDSACDPWLFAQEAERLGFDSIWAGEHVVSPRSDADEHAYHEEGVPRMPSSIVRLAGIAAVTRKIKIGTAILILPQHNVFVLAKQLATLDADSLGRLQVGVGIGWNRAEMSIVGGDFDRRAEQCLEALAVLKMLWTGEEVSFEGDFYRFPKLISAPPPRQRPHPPIHLGMNGKDALQRVVRFADGWLPSVYKPGEPRGGGPDRIARGRDEIDRLCRKHGRNPDDISITAIVADTKEESLDRKVVDRYLACGATRVVLLQSRDANRIFETEQHAIDWLGQVADRAFG
jgi:probable F420-dependent oxidoreductase